ncbi:pyridoxine 5'-phosphate synthase [Halioxenophilus sp. WMMB6]|uniref:pyridoxine 5'-phosphate synthase n=1 Tax=Halioxenophilus sp. WMMB6 TaxID=3073815 RepID=UPI00295EF8EC|nr:pyridoxine 5'-phosphate synthase [Halioxenophilus sp. WMMB6]
MAIALSVNLNKIALLRNSREGNFPDLIEHAETCIAAGVQGITVHPRPDQRHIRPDDCRHLTQLITPLSDIEFNIEGNPFEGAQGSYPGFMELVLASMPDQATLVPDGQSQLTSDHGFDLKTSGKRLAPIIAQLKNEGIRVSLFMDPDLEQIALAKQIGADRIELYTGPFAKAYAEGQPLPIFNQHVAAAQYATGLGLEVNAGHDLNLANMTLYRHLPGLAEVSIGHALTVDSIAMGMTTAIGCYLSLCAVGE